MNRRQTVIYKILYILVGPFVRWRFRYKASPEPLPRPSLVLCNHNTDLDPALVGLGFTTPLCFVASEHIFRWGLASRLIRWVFNPIPRVKGRADARTGMAVLRRLRAGHSVCVFAEGDRSLNGETREIVPSTGKLAKMCGGDLVTYRIQGGYLTTPRWAKSMRRGAMQGEVVGRYTAETLKALTPEQVNDIIRRDIYENAYERQRAQPVAYRGRRLAESLEVALYLCPRCGGTDTLKSEGNTLRCGCGLQARYTQYGFLEGQDLPYSTVLEWDGWQMEQAVRLVADTAHTLLCFDEAQQLYSVEPCVGSQLVETGRLELRREALVLGTQRFPLGEIADLAMVGQMRITFATTSGAQYEIISPHPRSASKYQQLFRALKECESEA